MRDCYQHFENSFMACIRNVYCGINALMYSFKSTPCGKNPGRTQCHVILRLHHCSPFPNPGTQIDNDLCWINSSIFSGLTVRIQPDNTQSSSRLADHHLKCHTLNQATHKHSVRHVSTCWTSAVSTHVYPKTTDMSGTASKVSL